MFKEGKALGNPNPEFILLKTKLFTSIKEPLLIVLGVKAIISTKSKFGSAPELFTAAINRSLAAVIAAGIGMGNEL